MQLTDWNDATSQRSTEVEMIIPSIWMDTHGPKKSLLIGRPASLSIIWTSGIVGFKSSKALWLVSWSSTAPLLISRFKNGWKAVTSKAPLFNCGSQTTSSSNSSTQDNFLACIHLAWFFNTDLSSKLYSETIFLTSNVSESESYRHIPFLLNILHKRICYFSLKTSSTKNA